MCSQSTYGNYSQRNSSVINTNPPDSEEIMLFQIFFIYVCLLYYSQLINIFCNLPIKMSTTFKIIENHIESSKASGRRSNILDTSRNLSPNSRVIISDNESSELEKDQILMLEIKQLQRQNKFLKKKIAELTAQLNAEQKVVKKNKNLGKGAPKQDTDPNCLSVDFFFKQINGLLSSIADLYRVEFTTEEFKEFSSRFSSNESNQSASRRYVYYNKNTLSKKLLKITLQRQQKRYSSLLDVFLEYYKTKQQADRYIRQNVDQLSTQVLKLNKMILDNATKRRSSLKGSCVRSQFCFDDNVDKNNLLLPWSIKAMSPPTTILMQDKDKQKDKFNLIKISELKN